jgi:glycerophosphoryl diester phosphodiesterase
MVDLFPRPTIFAHRGASQFAPENTLASFDLAEKQGATAIELDAQLTSDGHVVVIHDDTVDRTTEGLGRVRDLDINTVKSLDAGSHFDISFKGERIPTLEDVFATFGQRLLINIELKNNASPFDDLPAKVASLVTQYHLQERVIFSSFNPIAVHRIKRLLPETSCGMLCSGGWANTWMDLRRLRLISFDALHPDISNVDQSLVDRVHGTGSRIHVYTANQPDEIQRLLDLGVDGFFTDAPPLAIQLLNQHRQISKGGASRPNP